MPGISDIFASGVCCVYTCTDLKLIHPLVRKIYFIGLVIIFVIYHMVLPSKIWMPNAIPKVSLETEITIRFLRFSSISSSCVFKGII